MKPFDRPRPRWERVSSRNGLALRGKGETGREERAVRRLRSAAGKRGGGCAFLLNDRFGDGGADPAF